MQKINLSTKTQRQEMMEFFLKTGDHQLMKDVFLALDALADKSDFIAPVAAKQLPALREYVNNQIDDIYDYANMIACLLRLADEVHDEMVSHIRTVMHSNNHPEAAFHEANLYIAAANRDWEYDPEEEPEDIDEF